MSRQYQLPSGAYVTDAGTRQYQSPLGSYINETAGSGGVTIAGIVGDAVAAGPTAALYSTITINGIVGNAAAGGPTAGVSGTITIDGIVGNAAAGGSTATVYNVITIAGLVGNAAAGGPNASVNRSIVSGPGNAAAGGPTAAVGNFIMSDNIINNTGTVLSATSVYWTWTPSGRIGSMVGLSPQDGTGTTDANGRLSPGVAVATGQLKISVRGASADLDDVYEEYF